MTDIEELRDLLNQVQHTQGELNRIRSRIETLMFTRLADAARAAEPPLAPLPSPVPYIAIAEMESRICGILYAIEKRMEKIEEGENRMQWALKKLLDEDDARTKTGSSTSGDPGK
jgi:hypothetical protein